MIVLDTNVLSEPLRAEPNPAVLDWYAAVPDSLALTAVSVGELLIGVRMLPTGRRRDRLATAIEATLGRFGESVLRYDEPAARIYAQFQERRRAAGRPLSVEDGMIAAICRRHDAVLATRDVKDFDELGVELIDPWRSE